ncbi:MAG: hypothetical protein MJY89_04625 [Bacteroidales bacterium]|nr:hypothetical protein [Bacteroidales bacterium]
MKKSIILSLSVCLLASCAEYVNEIPEYRQEDTGEVSLSEIARLLSSLPMGEEQFDEVYEAVNSSTANGYDEEYMMADLFSSPGKGVGDAVTKASKSYKLPLRDMIKDYLEQQSTKSGIKDVEAYINSIIESGAQIYWPFADEWDGKDCPIITFDPGFGAESNYGYEIRVNADGATVVDSVFVDEELAKRRPVWVVNTNDDSAFTPFDLYLSKVSDSFDTKASKTEPEHRLFLQDLTLLRNYDSWFGGASEVFVKCGSASGFKASTDDELKLYHASLTDFMIVVKRKDIGKTIPFEALLVSDFTSQIEKIAFFMIEDDGGTTTSWKCNATVRYNSKSYGFDIEIPYKDKDDIIWRGQLSNTFFQGGETQGRFGDAVVTFRLE